MTRSSPAPTRAAMASAVGRCGLPATSAGRPEAVTTAARMAPAPGTRPSGVGYVASSFVPTSRAPFRTAVTARVELVVGEVAGEPDHDGIRRPLGHDEDAPGRQGLEHAVAAEHHRGGAGGQHAGRHVGGAQEVGVVGGDAAVRQLPVQLGPRRQRVVGGEQHAHPDAAQAGHRLVDAGNGLPREPHHAIEVDDPGPPGRRRPHRAEANPAS